MSKALLIHEDRNHCANCGKRYLEHYGDGLHCRRSKRGAKWFPAPLAESLKKTGLKTFKSMKIARPTQPEQTQKEQGR